MSREPEKSKPTISPNQPGQNFSGRFFGGAFFGVLLFVLIAWVCFLSLVAWQAVSSLFG
jgi:hypothetical protein